MVLKKKGVGRRPEHHLFILGKKNKRENYGEEEREEQACAASGGTTMKGKETLTPSTFYLCEKKKGKRGRREKVIC